MYTVTQLQGFACAAALGSDFGEVGTGQLTPLVTTPHDKLEWTKCGQP